MSTRRNFIDPRDLSAAISDLNAVPVTLTDAATITWDPKLGDYFVVTLGAAGRTMAAPTTTPREGGRYTFEIRQDATGSRTITTWPAIFDWGTPGVPTLTVTASKADIIEGTYRNGVMRVFTRTKGHN